MPSRNASATVPAPAATVPPAKPPRRPGRARLPAADNAPERPEPLALLRALQRSLEPSVVVETFARRLHDHYALEGVAFEHPEFGLRWGDRREHAFAARLKVDGTPLGQLEIYRQRAFGPRERSELKELSELLLHPLRNAISHACLQKQACEDALTGLLNRQALDRMLPRELAAAERNGQTLALVVIDVDHLKRINDSFGHAAGDQLLNKVALALSGALRRSDMAFRMGGDEFVLLLPATGEAGAVKVLARIRQALRHQSALPEGTPGADPADYPIRFSSGVATSGPGVDAATLFEAADRAMYRAKLAGRQAD